MAAKVDESQVDEQQLVECSLCFENDNLKRLPCNPAHIYCVKCLTKASEVTGILKCPLCRTVLEEGLDDIPSAGAPLDKFLCCDVCMRKTDKRTLAQIYCVICRKKFCTAHADSHNNALDDHKMITMDDYKKEYRKVEIRNCEKHTDEVYAVACKKCNNVFCLRCTLRPNACEDGSPHHFVELKTLSDEFKCLIYNMKLWIFDKEECLLGLVKQLTQILSNWDGDTGEMIAKLRDTRNEQIQALTMKYDQLEQTLINLRDQSKTEVTRYLDGDVGERLDKISRGVKRLDSRLYSHHEVDIVRDMDETARLTNELMTIYIPQYTPSTNHIKLVKKDTTNIELCVEIRASSDEFVLDIPEPTKCPALQVLARPIVNPPGSMKLLRECEVSPSLESVCQHGQYTFAGCENSIDKISEDGKVQKGFITIDGYACSVTENNENLIVLVGKSGNKFKVEIHELTGRLLQSWGTSIQYDYLMIKHQVADNKIVIPDPFSSQILVYSMSGYLIKNIPVDICTGGCIAMATVGDGTVVLSVVSSNAVVRVDIDSGEVMWTSEYVENPQGVVCYKERFVLVTNLNFGTRIWILDIDTGEYVSELIGEQRDRETEKYDMDVSGDTLIVTDDECQLIEYYKLD